ncbi:6-bladed beta-propeller [Niabella aquatica]
MKLKALLLACITTYSVVYGQPAKIYLSPKAATPAGQSLFFDSLRFYPLEANKKVEIGRYSYAYVADQFFYINNYFKKALLVYTKDGKFVKEISYKKLGESASPNYDKNKQQMVFLLTNKNYNLTQKDKIKIKNGFDDPRNKKYYKKYIVDLNDTLFAIKKAAITAFDILGAYNLKDDYYCTYEISVDKNYRDSIDYEVKIYKNTKFVNGYFPYDKRKESRYLYGQWLSAHTQESGKPGAFYITRPYVDTIYTLSNGVVTPAYQLILPMENSLPKWFFEKPFKNATERENFERNNGWLLRQIYSLNETDRFMIFTIGFLSNYGQYVYDKKNTATYDMRKVKPDSALYNLPLLMERSYSIGSNRKFYTLISPEDLKKVYELKDKSAPFPKELEACFKDSKNPSAVIVEFTIKTN